ncbi:MAG TPA: hypothetical protein VFK94_02210 [Patescibacteria group bacterium]|nr:hypothetical protein [Patescibacteria group bacterium]
MAPPTKVVEAPIEIMASVGFEVREGYQWTGLCFCGYISTGWPTQEQAQLRIDQHSHEHNTGEEMPDKAEVEQLTPEKFLPGEGGTPREPNPLWGQMAITATDILYKYSVAAAAGNTTAGTAAGSLGDQVSTTQITDATLGNLFDDVSGDENAASDVEYRGYFVHNAHATLTWTAPKVWISAEVAGGASAAIAVDTTAASAVGAAATQMTTIADESTAPAGQTFSAPTTKASGLALSDLAAGNVKGIWVRRTAANTAAVNNDGVTIRVEGDTAA